MSMMKMFGLKMDIPFITHESQSYRPPSWPPPRDWACIVDDEGNVVSRWGDPIWRFYPWAGKPLILNFGDGPKLTQTTAINRDNADLLRLVVTWYVWGQRGRKSVSTLKTNFFTPMRAIFALCSHEGVLASDLMHFPNVASKIPEVIASSQFDIVVSMLQRILDARQILGFTLLDQTGLRQLVAARREHFQEQTEYIPPRIWAYQVDRLRECLDDYMKHQQQVEDCFRFCVDAYAKNLYGIDETMIAYGGHSNLSSQDGSISDSEKERYFHTAFFLIATRFGILELLRRWVGDPETNNTQIGIDLFSKYLSLIQYAGLSYLLNFSLMRYEEGKNLRADCLYLDEDVNLGKIFILCGETTKTDPDSDARWPTSQSVKVAVDAMKSVSNIRIQCAKERELVAPSVDDIANPFLYGRSFEPWVSIGLYPYKVRPSGMSYSQVLARYPKLLDPRELEITQNDLKIARSVTPTLNLEVFKIGKPWPLTWHQLRRTGTVNMFCSGVVSDSTVQFQLKHRTRVMSLYYGRGSSNLNLNEEVRALLVKAQYEVMGREIAAVTSDRFVSPYGEDYKIKMVTDLAGFHDVVNVISEGDAKRFEAAAKKGAISFRTTILGGCMSREQCDGDCLESIAGCAGGAGGAFCKDVLFDRQRAEKNKVILDDIVLKINSTPQGSPRYRALEQERRGLENYFAYINQR